MTDQHPLEEARQRFEAMRERARQRKASMPDYPDPPEYVAELAATTEALMPLQLQAQAWQDDASNTNLSFDDSPEDEADIEYVEWVPVKESEDQW
jgi:hypothetical protein